jgi:acetate kinase
VTEAVLHEIQRCSDLAPLHNPSNSQGIQIAAELLAGVPQVACFDTAFHHMMPPKSYRYAIPADLARAHRIRRYGFHGLSFSYVSSLLNERRVIIAHLGSGCSAAAIVDGHSVDTTMGLTPMEGVVMGTRSGDVDAGVVLRLAGLLDIGAVATLLNKQSGMIGLTGGISSDMKEILALARGGGEHAAIAEEAVDVFVYSVQKKIGQLMAAIVFTGGIGENCAEVRARVMEGFSALGIAVDPSLNNSVPCGGVISVPRPGCKTKVIVVKTDEELQIARESIRVIRS